MEILLSRRQDNAGAVIPADSRALAVYNEYGELPQFCKTYGLTAQRYCAQNVEKAIRKGVPTFGLIVRSYGEDGIAGLIGVHITDAILRMGEDRDTDDYDVDFIAHAICESERFRLLSMASILRFFHLLKCGEFDIYGKVTPRKILEAFRKYAVEQQAKENRIAYEMEKERKEKEYEEARKNAVTWEEYCAASGINPEGGMEGHLRRMREQARKEKELEELRKKPLIVLFVERITQLIQILPFVEKIMRIKKLK